MFIHKESIEESQLRLFTMFLERFIEDGCSYKEIIEFVLSESVNLQNKTKDIHTIDRSNFTIIVYLNDHGSDVLKNMKKPFKKEDYENILTVLKAQDYIPSLLNLNKTLNQ